MSWAFVTGQAAGGGSFSAASATTVAAAFTNTVGSGNFVRGMVSWDATGTLNSVTDDKGNTYTLGLEVDDATSGQNQRVFYLWNITNAPKTITANFAASTAFTGVQIVEYSGIQTGSDPKDVQEGRVVAAPGTGANAASSSASGTATTATNDLIGGDIMGASAETITAGTSTVTFTKRFTHSTGDSASEDGNQPSIAATRAAFTLSVGSQRYAVFMTAYKEATGGSTGLLIDGGHLVGHGLLTGSGKLAA